MHRSPRKSLVAATLLAATLPLASCSNTGGRITEPQLDRNGDGIVDDAEYIQYRRQITVKQERAIAESADPNRDGTIDDEEWAAYTRRHNELGHPIGEPTAHHGRLPQPVRKIITGVENIVEGVIMPLGKFGKIFGE